MDKIIKSYNKEIEELSLSIESNKKDLEKRNSRNRTRRSKVKVLNQYHTRTPNELPLRDKNGRFMSSKKLKQSESSSKLIKSTSTSKGISSRLRRKEHTNPVSTKRIPD